MTKMRKNKVGHTLRVGDVVELGGVGFHVVDVIGARGRRGVRRALGSLDTREVNDRDACECEESTKSVLAAELVTERVFKVCTRCRRIK